MQVPSIPPLQADSKMISVFLCSTITNLKLTHIFKNLNLNKSNGWDNLPIGMTEICGQSISYPLKLVFVDSLQEGIFSESWKKENIVPFHKKRKPNSYKNLENNSSTNFGKKF